MAESEGIIDLDGVLLSWLTESVLSGNTAVATRRLYGGVNHEMTMLITESGARYVIRRYRLHNPCLLELALATRLADRVPMVEVVGADPDGSVVGTPTLVYRFVDGVPLNETLDQRSEQGADALGRAVGVVLARIGTVDFPAPGRFRSSPSAAGPTDFLVPDGRAVLADPVDAVDRALAVRHVDHGLTAREQEELRELARRTAPWVESVAAERRLVHMDFNPKNVLVRRRGDDWTVSAVIDWEFAFSGSPLTDVGNMLRFAGSYPPAFAVGFREGFVAAGGALPDEWQQVSQALDLFTLAEILTHPPADPLFGRVAELVRGRLDATRVHH